MSAMYGSTAVQSPDRRALGHMAADIRIVHIRLEMWAKWARDKAPNGWPERTILGRLIEEGPGASQSSHTTSDMPEGIAETDRAVGHLPDEDRKVVRQYYLHWAPRDVMARKLRMPLTKFDSVLNRARWRICGYLSACPV